MLKSVFSFFFGLTFIGLLTAQSAQDWLNQVNNTYQKTTSYYIKFEVKSSDEPKQVEVGELYAVKEKYSLHIMDILQMYDGKSLYTISKADKEATISKPTPESDDFLTPTKILGMYQLDYKADLDKSTTVAGKKIQWIKLTPIKTSEINYISVGIDTQTNTLVDYKEYYKNGSSRSIAVKDYLENLIIPRALFKFDQSKYEKDGYIVTHL